MAKRVNYRDRVEDGELDLSMSDLQEVPVRDIALAKKAVSLDLSNNRLTSLGKNFPSLTHLVKLDLSKNQIAILPNNFGDLVLLKHLDLYSNKLNHLPLSFGRLINLKWLDLKNNPLVPALQEIAGPCQDTVQCQNCAKRVVQVLADSQRRLDEERIRQEKELKEQEMAEKAAAKKEQQKNKKAVKNEKKKSAENGVRPQEQRQPQKKKEKLKQSKASAKRAASGSFLGRLFKRVFQLTLVVSLGLAVLYWLDIERFRQVQVGAGRALDAAVALLPPQALVLLNQTSTFLNTDPRVKPIWTNLRDIAGLLKDRVTDAVSTLVVVIPVYLNDVKRLVFESNNATKT